MIDKMLTIARIAAAAGAEQLTLHRDRFTVREKAEKDLVTDADIASQRAIQSILMSEFPDHGFIGEEEGNDQFPTDLSADSDQQPIWIVDPLDGTVNYVHQLQSYAVSIGMYHAGQLQLAVIHDPVCHEVYWAIKGRGAYRNDRPIATSNTRQLEHAILACSFSVDATCHQEELSRFNQALDRSQTVRRLGSAALNLCYVATGQLDGYWATSVKPWDVAAGALIVQEAGGTIRDIEGGRFDLWNPRFIAACNDNLRQQISDCFGLS